MDGETSILQVFPSSVGELAGRPVQSLPLSYLPLTIEYLLFAPTFVMLGLVGKSVLTVIFPLYAFLSSAYVLENTVFVPFIVGSSRPCRSHDFLKLEFDDVTLSNTIIAPGTSSSKRFKNINERL